MQKNRPIVVVGGGYAGLSFIRRIRQHNRHLPITLIDKNPYHTMLVETHQVAAGSRPADSILVPFDQVGGFRFIRAEVTGVDTEQKRLSTTAGPIEYDRLVLALGSVDHDFGVPGVREHCQTLRGLADAEAIRSRLAVLPPEEPVVIAGGGLTGVELAAHIALTRPHGRALTLVEASPTLLPGVPARLSWAARRRLGHLGVNVVPGAPVVRVEAGQAHLRDGTSLPFGLMIWAAGVRAHPLIATLNLPTDRAGRAVIGPDFQTPLPDVYVIGDCAAGHVPSAQAAIQQGAALADRLMGRAASPLRNKGILVDLGGHRAVGLVGSITLRGLLPGWLKRVTELLWISRVLGVRAVLCRLLGLPAAASVRPRPSGGHLPD